MSIHGECGVIAIVFTDIPVDTRKDRFEQKLSKNKISEVNYGK